MGISPPSPPPVSPLLQQVGLWGKPQSPTSPHAYLMA